jgi:hypothetical protein
MSVKFKYFVNEPFKAVLEKIVKTEDLHESVRLALWRFKNKYNEETKSFVDRMNEIQKEFNAKIIALSEEEKEVQTPVLNEQAMKKLEELVECESELKPLKYTFIKDCKIQPIEMDLLEHVLSEIPEE